jgi:hypothetical protein
LICYPFHPRSGETVVAVGSKRHGGAEHFVIRQPDRTLALLPVWMTEPDRSATQLVAQPRLSVERLSDLHAFLDAFMASCTKDSPRCEGAGDAEDAMQSKADRSVRRGMGAEGASPRPAAPIGAVASGTAGGGRSRPAGTEQGGR